MREGRFILFLVYVLFGLYFLDDTIGFYPIPSIVSEFNKILVLIGGILILIGGVSILMHNKRSKIFDF